MSHARRHTLAIALVALALCADRTVASSTSHQRAERTTFAGQIVRKLQVSFRRIVPAVEPLRERSTVAAAPTIARPTPLITPAIAAHPLLSPFESRLPPPGC
jgi:hypothetical protein